MSSHVLEIRIAMEYNQNGVLLLADNYPGAFARGKTWEEAIQKMDGEIRGYVLWSTGKSMESDVNTHVRIIEKKQSSLQVCDADSDILLESEKPILYLEEYRSLKALALKSAADFQKLYDMIPNKSYTSLSERNTFYGPIPRTASEMYRHTNSVTDYYMREIGVLFRNLPRIVPNRKQAFSVLERRFGYLDNELFNGSYDEQWTLRKVLRRFLWHDRIHARAMTRMALNFWGPSVIQDIFHCFS